MKSEIFGFTGSKVYKGFKVDRKFNKPERSLRASLFL